MGVPDILSTYETIWSLSQGMLNAAQDNQWEQLIALQEERYALVNYLKAMGDAVFPDEAPNNQKALLIRKILECDAETRRLSEVWMGEMRQMLESIGTEKKLIHAYAGNE